MNWKQVALWLATCISASRDLEPLLDETDRLQRLQYLCAKVSKVLRNQDQAPMLVERTVEEVLEELDGDE